MKPRIPAVTTNKLPTINDLDPDGLADYRAEEFGMEPNGGKLIHTLKIEETTNMLNNDHFRGRRTLPVATEYKTTDKYAGKRLTSDEQVEINERIFDVVKEQAVTVVSKNGTTLGVKGRGTLYFRSHWRFIKLSEDQGDR
jgi:hypothetical protein